jgi:hypothetical protein
MGYNSDSFEKVVSSGEVARSILQSRCKTQNDKPTKVLYNADVRDNLPLDGLNLEIVDELDVADLFYSGLCSDP